MATLALLDILAPYVVGGAAIGQPLHELLSALFVTEIETAFDDNGVCISGIVRFSAELDVPLPRYTPPATITWNPSTSVDHRTQRTAGAYWDFPDIAITFRLTAPRTSSPVADLVVSGGPGGSPAPLTNAGVSALLSGLGQGRPLPGQLAADSVDTVFHLDLLIDAATLHLAFLTGALLQADGMLAADPANPEVTVTLPKIKLSLEQTAGSTTGAPADPVVTLNFDSWAAHDIDDPAGAAYGELIRMQPPYALFGPNDVLGFGFNSVILDMSGTETPPELLEKFGVGDDFRGIYLPDVRIFAKPPGLKGAGVDISARELLIGIGPEGGVSGIFGVDVVKPDAPQSAAITIYDEFGGLVVKLLTPEIADPTQPAPSHTTLPVSIPPKSQWVVDVTGGDPPYNIDIDGQQQTTDPVQITLTAGQTSRTIGIDIADVHVGGQSRHIDVPVSVTGTSLTAPDGGNASTAKGAVLTVTTAGPPGYGITMLDFPGQEKITVLFTPEDAIATISNGGAPQPLIIAGGRASVPLAHGATVNIAATWNVAATPPATPVTFNAQFQYDQPQAVPNKTQQDPDDPAWTTFAATPDRVRTIPSRDTADPNGGWEGTDAYLLGSTMLQQFVATANANPGASVTLVGEASKEKVPLEDYNLALSKRRIWVIRKLLAAQGVNNFVTEVPEGEQPPSDPYLAPGRGAYRRVDAKIVTDGTPAAINKAAVRIARPPRPKTPQVQKPTVVKREPAGTDTVRFKELHFRMQLDHNRLIALELRLKVDVQTALEKYLTTVKQQNAVPAQGQGSTRLPVGKLSDPNDGVLDMRIQVTLDDTVDRWTVLASLFEEDSDGLLQTPPPTSVATGTASENFWRDFFGVTIALAPIIDASASSNTPAGDIAALTIAAGVPLAAVKLDVVHVPRITLYGGELVISHDPNGTRGALLLDVEVALVVTMNIGSTKIIDTDPKNPITVRYKAVGFATSDEPQIRDLVPVFDSSKGYSINIPSTGGIKVPAPLGDILQVAGTRIARSNPTNLELDLTVKADLGVVSIDKMTVRIPLEGGFAPTITALGVHVDISGAIEGGGYLAVYEDGFAGQMDVSLSGLGVRVAAGLSVRHVPTPPTAGPQATAVILTLEVDFPVPIALGNSGLGIYGFGGLFALHFKRDEHPSDPVPALDWLTRVNGNPMDITGWVPNIDRWAIGLGAVLGTMDSGFTLNVKGMIIFEMPGPRILLVMKAKIIWIRPPRKGNPTATILAVIDIDLGRGRITVGLTFDYGIKPLLSIHVPVRAIFPFDDLPHFAIDAGTWYTPATVTFFDLFKARGYMMIRGRGIPDSSPSADNYDGSNDATFPLLPERFGGLSIATGVTVSFLWGDKGAGLYLSVGASVDVGIGFEPIFFEGQLRVWGELHLWVVGIEASAKLKVIAGQVPDGPPLPDPEYPGDASHTYQPTKDVAQIDGEVHGEVDLFFFTISGSVHVSLGDKPDSPPAPPPLVTGVSLQSRAAALLQGVSSDRPIDGKLTDAHADQTAIADNEAVPIDSIIVLHLDCTPRVNGNFTVSQVDASSSPATVTTKVALAPPDGPAAPAVRRGEPYYTYRIKSITLDNTMTPGAVPIVWWPNVPQPDSDSKRELALLTRVPDPHPCAVERSKHAEDFLSQHWESICDPVAPPTSVLWTFHDEPLGPSSVGWIVMGTAWPDPPGTTRQSLPKLRLDVAETWRSGDLMADLLVDIAPARIIGAAVSCPEGCGGKSVVVRPMGKTIAMADAPIDAAIAGTKSLALTSPPVHLSALASILATDVDAMQARVSRDCYGRLLEAPFLRAKPTSQIAGHPLAKILADLLNAASKLADDFDDVIALSTGEIVSIRMFLYMPRILFGSGQMQMRFFDANGKFLESIKIHASGATSHMVTNDADVPATWLDLKGPWRCRVLEVLALLGAPDFALLRRPGVGVLVDTKVPDGTRYVQLGIADLAKLIKKGLSRPSYMVGVIETLSAAEVERHDIESEIKSHQQSELNGALEAIPDPPALLMPSTTYTVTINWEYATCNSDGSDANDWQDGAPQAFRFRTDDKPIAPRTLRAPGENADKTMPVRLDPWVILTDPDEGERFYFHNLPIRIVFSVDYLLTMFDTYGEELRAIVRAASYKNVNPASPGFPQTWVGLKDVHMAATLDEPTVKPLAGVAVLTPWEDMVRDVVKDRPCITTSGDVTRHTIVDVNLLLEPRTDYILDVEPVNAPAPPAGQIAAPLFRRAFATSRYADVPEMCADVAKAKLTEVPADDVSELTALTSAPAPLSRAKIDFGLRAAGLRPVVDVTDPEIEVVWNTVGGTLQPRVIVIRTPEPLVRTRKEPTTYEPPGQPRLQREVIALVDKPYLEIVATPGIAGAAELKIVSQPGLNLVIVVADSGRNKPIALSVRRHDNALLGEGSGTSDIPLFNMTLDAAIWEVA